MAIREASLGERRFPRVGLGTNRLTDTPANREFLSAAIEAGIGLVDTAHSYSGGESERTIGAALAPSGDDMAVATKGGYGTGEARPEVLREQLEQSFRSLGVETIELYYLHRIDPETPLADSLGLLAEYRDAGRIEHIGVSAVSVEEVERAREVAPIAAVQNEYNLAERGSDDVIDYCEREGILFVPYYPLRSGADAAAEIASEHEATPQQVLLAWLLMRSPVMVPIPGTLSIEHLRENLGSLDIELSEDEFAALATY
jgi:pyridoxine 4-dehydrogenase